MLKRIYTIGHSTPTLDELVSLFREHAVTRPLALPPQPRVIDPPPQAEMF